MTKRATTQDGFTLIELLLYVSIVGGILLSVSLFFATVADSRIKNQSISEVNRQGELITERVAQAIRNANSITSPTAGNSAASLTMAMPVGGENPTIFNMSGTAIQVQEGVSGAIELSSSKVQISGLSFTNLSRSSTPGIVRFSFTVSRTNNAGKNEYDYQKTFTASAALRWP